MDKCPLCERPDFRSFPIHYFLAEKRFDACECGHCGFVFILPRPSSSDLALMYGDEYFLHDGADLGAHSMSDYETAAVKGSVKFPEILGHIKRVKPEGHFFEVGAGMGYFLNYVRSQGFHVSGIEYAPLGARVSREKFGLEVECRSFEEFAERGPSYDVIFFGDVLEHFVDPLAAIQKAIRLLKRDGVVEVEVPSMFNCIVGRCAKIGLRTVGRSKKMPMPPYHLNEFTPRTLKKILLDGGCSNAGIIQRIKHPSTIALRGSFIEKGIKLGLQYPNYFVTKTFGVLGDRLLGIGRK
jgi:SAM-dependent methyltransferase